jgi:hypothetical protein
MDLTNPTNTCNNQGLTHVLQKDSQFLHIEIKMVSDLRPGTPVSSTNKIDRHDITEIVLRVALNTINVTPNPLKLALFVFVMFALSLNYVF